jgi:putative Mn2+ efflux pump MntP
MPLDKFAIILLLAIAANLDNLGVGIAYGLRRRYIPALSNFAIALISAGLTLSAMLFGKWLERVLPVRVANDVGALIIIGVGIWVCWESVILPTYQWTGKFLQQAKQNKKYKHKVRPDRTLQLGQRSSIEDLVKRKVHSTNFENNNNIVSQRVTCLTAAYPVQLKETLLLGISLSLNAIAGGVGASLSGYDATLTSTAIGIFSYITIALGQNLSRKYFSKLLGKLSQQIAGLLLIAIGIYEIFF